MGNPSILVPVLHFLLHPRLVSQEHGPQNPRFPPGKYPAQQAKAGLPGLCQHFPEWGIFLPLLQQTGIFQIIINLSRPFVAKPVKFSRISRLFRQRQRPLKTHRLARFIGFPGFHFAFQFSDRIFYRLNSQTCIFDGKISSISFFFPLFHDSPCRGGRPVPGHLLQTGAAGASPDPGEPPPAREKNRQHKNCGQQAHGPVFHEFSSSINSSFHSYSLSRSMLSRKVTPVSPLMEICTFFTFPDRIREFTME